MVGEELEIEHIAKFVGQRGRNVTICLAISPTAGLIHHTTMQGGMNRDRFNEFLVQVSARLNEHEMQTSTLLAMKLPPYSPFLNIVEQAISALKAAIKRDISRHAVQVEMGNWNGARNQDIPLGEFRQRLLLEASDRNVGTITVQKCVAWYRFMQTYLPRCLNREVIEG